MGGVKHGETHDVGLLIHYVIQSQEWEVLEKEEEEQGERERQTIQVVTMLTA